MFNKSFFILKFFLFFSFAAFLKAEIDFFPLDTYETEKTPITVVVGDLNGDQGPDLAVANLNSKSISLYNNQGNGTFLTGTVIPFDTPSDMAIADVDQDGDLDLIVCNLINATIHVLKNNGNGTFPGIADIYPINLAGFPATIEIGDLNGDSFPDLTVGMAGNGTSIRIFRNDGTGAFILTGSISAFDQIFSFGLGNFNEDNFPDIAMPVFWANSIIFFTNNGSGSMIPKNNAGISLSNKIPIPIETDDLDGDNDFDLVVGLADAGPNKAVAIFKNNGTGIFTKTTNYSYGNDSPTFIDLKDLENDGDIDIAVARNNTNIVSLMLNQGNGTFDTPTNFIVGNRPRSIKCHDVNNDSRQDIIVVNADDNSVSVLLSRFLEISDIPDQVSNQNQLAGPYPFQLLGSLNNIVLSAKSSNSNLVPETNIAFGGTGKNRTIALQPLTDQIGGTLITITASNTVDSLAASDSFVLAVVPANSLGSNTNIIQTNIFFNTLAAHGYTLDIRKPKLGKRINLKTELGLKKFKARIITANIVSNVSYALAPITNTMITNLDFVPASKLKQTKKRIFERKGIKYKVTNRRDDLKTGKNMPTGEDFINLVIKIEGTVQTNSATIYFINTYKASVE